MCSPFFGVIRAWVWGYLLAGMALTGCCAGQYNGDTSLELPKVLGHTVSRDKLSL